MVTLIIIFNVLISAGCLYVAGQVWKLRSALSKAADAMTVAERSTYHVLSGAPRGIGRGETGVHQLRQQYQQLEVKLQRVQHILKLLGLGQWVWQWYGRRGYDKRRYGGQYPKRRSHQPRSHRPV